MKYKLIVDSCCELTNQLKEDLSAVSVPLSMSIGEKVFIDDENINIKEFLSEMNSSSERTLSACPSPDAYVNSYDNDAVNFVITISSELSGSYSSASISKDMAAEKGQDVYVFNSKSASAGETLVGIKINEMIKEKKSKDDIIQGIEKFIGEMKTFFVLENLDNLIKSGRISRVVGTFANVMQIKPVLGSDGAGNITSYAKVRGSAASIDKLCKMIGEHTKTTKNKTLVVTHCYNEKEANRLKKMAEEIYEFKDIIIQATKGLSSMYANLGGIIIAF